MPWGRQRLTWPWKEKNDMKTKLLCLEDVIWALEEKAESGENNRCGVSFSECQVTPSHLAH